MLPQYCLRLLLKNVEKKPTISHLIEHSIKSHENGDPGYTSHLTAVMQNKLSVDAETPSLQIALNLMY